LPFTRSQMFGRLPDRRFPGELVSKGTSQIIVALTPSTLNLFFTRALVFCRHGNGRLQAIIRLALPAVRGIGRSKAIDARLTKRSDGSRVRVRLRTPVLEFGMDREASCYSAWLTNARANSSTV
jgi:hypothetical protein